MRVLLTGGSGLIGTALRSALEARGDVVVTLVRPTSVTRAGATVAWDPATGVVDRAALDTIGPIDGVVNLAGAGIADKRWTAGRRAELLSSRVTSTSMLVDAIAALADRPTVLVSGSAIGFYGSRGDELIDESTGAGDGYLAEICRRWEEAATPATELGIRLAVARTGIVLTALGGALAKQLPLFKAGLGGRLASGSQWMSWITLDDEVRALLWLLDHPEISGPVNLTAPVPVTNAEFTRTLGRALRRPSILAVPAAALKVVLGSELVNEAILASQRVEPTVLTDTGFVFGAGEIKVGLDIALGRSPGGWQ